MSEGLTTCAACEKVYASKFEICPHCRGAGPGSGSNNSAGSGWIGVMVTAFLVLGIGMVWHNAFSGPQERSPDDLKQRLESAQADAENASAKCRGLRVTQERTQGLI